MIWGLSLIDILSRCLLFKYNDVRVFHNCPRVNANMNYLHNTFSYSL